MAGMKKGDTNCGSVAAKAVTNGNADEYQRQEVTGAFRTGSSHPDGLQH